MESSVARDRADGSEVESAPGTGVPATLGTGEARPHTEKSGCPYAAGFDSSMGISKPSEAGPFDPDQLEKSEVKVLARLVARFFEWLATYPHRALRVLRWCTPVLNIPIKRWSWVLRYDEVREVLSHDAKFPVPWTDKMKELTSKRNFVLGMPRDKTDRVPPDKTYRDAYQQLAEAFPREDVPTYVTPRAVEETEKILADKYDGRKFDAIQEVITAVPTRMCESYYGIPIRQDQTSEDETARSEIALFGKASLAISRYLFVPDTSDSERALGKAAANLVSGKIRAAIVQARNANNPKDGCPLTRLVRMKLENGRMLDDEQIHAHMLGMVLGFIPTNVLAGGNILQTLLLRPDFLKRTSNAARAGDDDLLWRCLREALRFRHINLGPWRLCPNGYTLGAGGPRPKEIPAGNKVLAIIQTAMFDPKRIERPHVFDPDRPDDNYMVFGVGQHWCLGAYIAAAQLTQTFKLLLSKGKLEAVAGEKGRMKRFSVYPLHLDVRIHKP